MSSIFHTNFSRLAFLVTFLYLLPTFSDAQIWTRIYWYSSGTKPDDGKSIVEAENGSLIVAGGYLGHLVKLDKKGDILWRKSFNEIEQATDLTLTSDGGICLVGFNRTKKQLWLIKTNTLGEKLWSKKLDDNDQIVNLLQNKDGGFTILTVVQNQGLIITDANGQILTKMMASGFRFIQLQSGEYLIPDGAQLKLLNADGIPIWGKPLAGARSVAATTDGNFVTMGYDETNQVLYLTKWDINGNEIWYKTYPQLDVRPYQYLWNKMVVTSNDEIAFIAHTDGKSAFIAKTDADGNLLCSRTQELDNLSVILENLIATSDNGFALVGTRSSNSSNGLDNDLFVMKTDSICQTADLEIYYVEKGGVDTVYSNTFSYKYGPNPCHPYVNFEIQPTKAFDGKMMLVIYDALGRVMQKEQVDNGNLTIMTNELPGGMYFLKFYDNGKAIGKVGKLAVQR
ncbi:MAG: T9SS type A sorting domain-containing protein [Bacteroidetes bacterium]|nr:T9SS type A sorting domain-containing protein [Bacteroidota bacterium]